MTARTLALLAAALLTAGSAAAAQNDRRDRARDTYTDWTRDGFTRLDRNDDGRITRKEWRWSWEAFDEHDRNGDGQLTRREFLAKSEQRGRSERRSEQRSSDERRSDGRSADELRSDERRTGQRSDTFWAGYDRGQLEGRAAGREDRERNQGWDLEGQRELETADSGYTPAMGPRGEYQAGYRDGFRQAYRDGYGR